MQAVGKKNRTSLHSLYDFVLMTRGILCIGTGGPTYKRTRGLLCVGISTHDLDNSLKIVLDCLQTCNAIKNDNNCTRIVADKFIDKVNPRIEFRLREV